MQYVLVLPVHSDEVAITDPFTQCVSMVTKNDYTLRTYRCTKPFNIDLFKIDAENGTSSYSRTLNGVKQ